MVVREVLPEGSSIIDLSYFNPMYLRPAVFAMEIANPILYSQVGLDRYCLYYVSQQPISFSSRRKHRGNTFRCMHMIDGADDHIANKIV